MWNILQLLQYCDGIGLDQGNYKLKEEIIEDPDGNVLKKEYSYNAIQSQLQPIPEVANWSEKFYDIK